MVNRAILLALTIIMAGCSLLSEKSDQETELPLTSIEMAEGDYTYLFKSSYLSEWFAVKAIQNETSSYSELTLHGGLSRLHPKKSFKLRESKGEEVTILSAQYDDKSLCRYMLSDFLFRKAGFDTPSLNRINLQIDDIYQGIYLQRENVKEYYLKRRELPMGSIYKMNLNGSFTFTTGQTVSQLFKKVVPDDDLTYTDLIELITFIDGGLDESRMNQFEKLVDIESLLSYIAVSKIINHSDGIRNNIVIYYNASLHRFQFIPWDLDQTFEGAPTSLPQFTNGLFEKVEEIPSYRTRIDKKIKELFDADELKNELTRLASEIDETHPYDPYIHTTLEDECEMIVRYIDAVDLLIQ